MLGTTPLGRIWDQVIGDANHSAMQSTPIHEGLRVAKHSVARDDFVNDSAM